MITPMLITVVGVPCTVLLWFLYSSWFYIETIEYVSVHGALRHLPVAFPRFLSACAALAGAQWITRSYGAPHASLGRARLRVKSRASTQSQMPSPTRLRRITRRVVRGCAIASM